MVEKYEKRIEMDVYKLEVRLDMLNFYCNEKFLNLFLIWFGFAIINYRKYGIYILSNINILHKN